MLVTLNMCFFTDWVVDRDVQVSYGTVMICIISAHMLVFLMMMLGIVIKNLHKLVVLLANLFKKC